MTEESAAAHPAAVVSSCPSADMRRSVVFPFLSPPPPLSPPLLGRTKDFVQLQQSHGRFFTEKKKITWKMMGFSSLGTVASTCFFNQMQIILVFFSAHYLSPLSTLLKITKNKNQTLSHAL
ncbi:hypothetical protein NE237_011392 [Protea cynaroides]|uniref:Uncharacterized protein n=1 Tax=Protea cynaroides TaxID=273540 RepID=A0A9Q0GZT6_9MAGN|nr:hypothetical protein NE237_011392 [Protea cynaroides]